MHAPLAHVGVMPPHARHAPPLVPHAPLSAPPTQMPFSQQPPLHSALAPHCWLHLCVVVLQASSAPQSAAELQPHAPARHRCPAMLVVQSTQLVPDEPHWLALVPATHALGDAAAAQQPPLHGSASEQLLVEQVLVLGWHSAPAGQSALVLQPHW
jgi:hypothetical protein